MTRPAAGTPGLEGWPQADAAVMPDGYCPPGRTLADYRTVDPLELRRPHACGGVVVPASAAEAFRLRRWLVLAEPSLAP